MLLSIIISTKNRPLDLIRCIQSILVNNFSEYEICIVDEGTCTQPAVLLDMLGKHPGTISYRKIAAKGLSFARNYGVSMAKGDVCVFTDDDCIVSKNWLANIHNFFQKNKNISTVCGNTLPYQASKHKSLICPATFFKHDFVIKNNTSGTLFDQCGRGNNMSFRKEIFQQFGYFKTWLGAGSVSENGAEEYDFFYRLLKNNRCLAHKSSIVVYHNRWITYRQEQFLQSKYTVGLTAFIIFTCLTSHNFSLMNSLSVRIHNTVTAKLITVTNRILAVPLNPRLWYKRELLYALSGVYSVMKGICIGLLFGVLSVTGNILLPLKLNRNNI